MSATDHDNDDLYRQLGSIEAKLDILLAQQPKITERVATLENSNSWVKGAAAVISFCMGTMGWILARMGVL